MKRTFALIALMALVCTASAGRRREPECTPKCYTVPDTGSTLALLAMGLGGMAAVGYCLRRKTA